jgi:hypothetical protein
MLPPPPSQGRLGARENYVVNRFTGWAGVFTLPLVEPDAVSAHSSADSDFVLWRALSRARSLVSVCGDLLYLHLKHVADCMLRTLRF